MGEISLVLQYALLPLAAAVAAAVAAAIRRPSAVVRGYVQHFAAGVVFSVVAVEVLPDVVREHKPALTIVGFAAGTLAMLALKALTRRLGGAEEGGGRSGLPVGMLAGVAVDLLVDGLLVAVGFAAGAKEGRLLVVALTLEMLSLALAVASTLLKGGASRARTIGVTSALGLLVAAGAVGGAVALRFVSESVLDIVLSFALAALLYLVTEELLVEAHEEPETPLVTASFFAGFLLFLVLGML